ncbi:MAG TPA: hypothetical protein VF571_19890 [Pyrinomonadaceae bacterium]|jgi:hypothetical protein
MNEVDYLKLCEQYVNFLIASAGVSITVLTLVLTFGFKSETQDKPAGGEPAKEPPIEVDLRSFLVAALIVSTVYCFIGAQMMTETAGFFSYKYPSAKTTSSKPSDKENPLPQTPGNSEPTKERSPEDIEFGERLFLLASTNIFITVILLLFALMLLPTASEKVEPTSIRWISVPIFLVVVICALGWMCLAIKYRMHAEGALLASIIVFFSGFAIGGVVSCYPKLMEHLLWWTFIPIGCFPAILLFHFAWIFSDPSKPKADNTDVLWLFIFPITFSYVSLGIVGMRMMFPKKNVCVD